MSTVTDADAKAFLSEIEIRRGGTIGYKTFSTFYADNRGTVRDYGVFFYDVNNHFWFEDFEHETNFFGFRIKPGKNTPKYEKYESDFDPGDVETVRTVRKKAAKKFVSGYIKAEKVRTANLLGRLFSEVVTEIKMKDGKIMYFQFIDKTVEKMIEKSKGSSPASRRKIWAHSKLMTFVVCTTRISTIKRFTR